MHETHLRAVDLNLLVPLDALLTHRSVTKAAAAIHLSQPAMSRALSRLRHLLDDPLLARGSGEAILTPRALALVAPLRQILSEVSGLVAPQAFDPADWQDEVTIAATDHQMILLLPTLMQRLERTAPLLNLRIVPFLASTIEQLRTGAVRLGFGLADALPASFRSLPLYEDGFVTLLRRNHPKAGGMSAEVFAALDHILVTVLGQGPGLLDTLLARRGLQRRVALRLPHFYAALAVAARTDLVVSLPESIARRFADAFDLDVLPTPFVDIRFTIALIWPPASMPIPPIRGCEAKSVLPLRRLASLRRSVSALTNTRTSPASDPADQPRSFAALRLDLRGVASDSRQES